LVSWYLSGVILIGLLHLASRVTTSRQRISQGNELKVEARSRIDGTNRKKAVDQVHKKFKKADFSKAIGVILFPRTKAATGKEDILVVDPDGNARTIVFGCSISKSPASLRTDLHCARRTLRSLWPSA
jgi:hypothetical protein